jgi:hypothetical protein
MKTMMIGVSLAAVTALTVGAAAWAAPRDAEPMLVFAANDTTPQPSIKAAVASINERICRTAWSTPVSDDEALSAIEAQARGLGANGLVAVRYEHGHADLKAACWQELRVHATAVVFNTNDAMAQNTSAR